MDESTNVVVPIVEEIVDRCCNQAELAGTFIHTCALE